MLQNTNLIKLMLCHIFSTALPDEFLSNRIVSISLLLDFIILRFLFV